MACTLGASSSAWTARMMVPSISRCLSAIILMASAQLAQYAACLNLTALLQTKSSHSQWEVACCFGRTCDGTWIHTHQCAKAAPDLRIMLGCESMGHTGADNTDEEIRPRPCAEQEDQPSALKVLDVRDSLQQCLVFCSFDFELTQHKLWCAHWGCQESRCRFLLEYCGCLLSTLSLKGPRVGLLSPNFQCWEGSHLRGSTLPSCHGEVVSWRGATILHPRSGGNPQFVQDSKRHTDHPKMRRGVPHGEACLRQQATNVVPMRTTWALMGRPARLLHPGG